MFNILFYYLVSNETKTLLTSALLLNPEVTTFWNMRRELVIDGYLRPNDELLFSAVVLTFKPKCAEIFNYRRWIFSNILKGKLLVNLFLKIGAMRSYSYKIYITWYYNVKCKLINSPKYLS